MVSEEIKQKQIQIQNGEDCFIKFANELKNDNRFFIESNYLELFNIIIEQSICNIDEYKELYRGRINKKNDATPYMGKMIGMPSPDISTSHGRANPYGINYMYLSENSKTVIAELRPSIYDYISVGKFKLKTPLRVVKIDIEAVISSSAGDKWGALFLVGFKGYLSASFSRPIDINNKELDYLPSQYFSEYCKKKEFDGIMYLSSVMDNNSIENYNYVFFNDSNLEYISTDVHIVEGLQYNSVLISSKHTIK